MVTSTQNTFDIVVIGGGVTGTAVAYELSKSGLHVALLERGGIASGTSGRCDGNVLVCDKAPGYDMELNRASLELFPLLADELSYDIHWRRKGSVLLTANETENTLCDQLCAGLQHIGLPARMLTREEVLADEPGLNPDIAGGMETACDGSLNPMALAQGLALGFTERGGRLFTNTDVRSVLCSEKGEICAVETGRGRINTKAVVACAGAWTADIGRMVGLSVPINPREGQILVGEKSRRVGRRKIMEFGYMAAKFNHGDYQRDTTPEMDEFGVAFVFEPTEAGNFLIGSSRRFAGFNTASHRRVLRAMAQRAMRFMPLLQEIKVIRSYAGVRPFTPDHLPIVSATEVPGFFIAAGHEGDGIGLSLITGKLMSEIVRGGPTTLDVAPLAFSRFSRRASVPSPLAV